MEVSASLAPICGTNASPSGSVKRVRKPDQQIYVPRQVRERQKALEATVSPSRDVSPQNANVVTEPVRLVDTGEKMRIRNAYSVKTILQPANDNSLSLSSCENHKSMSITADSPIYTTAKQTEELLTDESSPVVDVSSEIASKCSLDELEPRENGLSKPAFCEPLLDTEANGDTSRSRSDDESDRPMETVQKNAVEVSGFPADYDERDLRKLVHLALERIVWVNDTCCVCVLECSEPETDADALIDELRTRLDVDAPLVRIVPLAEADLASRRKWLFVERHRRSSRFATDVDLPPRPRTSAIVASRMILRALGRATGQQSSASDD